VKEMSSKTLGEFGIFGIWTPQIHPGIPRDVFCSHGIIRLGDE